MTKGSVQISNAQYHADPAINASKLKTINAHGARAYWNCFINPDRPEKKTTPAMLLGTLTHAAVLEPELFEKEFTVVSSRNTKKGKEEAKEAEEKGLTAVTQSDWDLALKMRKSVTSDKEASSLLTNGVAEKSWWQDDEKTGLTMKARTDWFTGDTIVDLKTSRSGASPKEFAKAVANFSYHLQAQHYLNVCGVKRFIFLVVQSEFPFDTALYELDEDAMREGQRLCREGLDRIAECTLMDHWPHHSEEEGIQTLSLPRWAFPPTPTKK
jgi:exodeoxyribonuclease VIII